MLDRRFGENNPCMTPEERALERFVREKQQSNRKKAVFDLEDDSEDGGGLTHLGQSLAFTKADDQDDFEDGLSGSEEDALETHRERKRPRLNEPESDAPDRPKSKQEVMAEVIAKSKLHKYERQKAKGEDDDLRDQLDAELSGIQKLMRRSQPSHNEVLAPESEEPQAANRNATDLTARGHGLQDKEYDERVRQMALDARSKPTERTKTDEEKAAEEAERLKYQEQQRIRRMRGEPNEMDDDAAIERGPDDDLQDDELDGLGAGLRTVEISQRPLGVDDEDDFILDPDLVASGSELDYQDNDGFSDASGTSDESSDSYEDLDGVDDVVEPTPQNLPDGSAKINGLRDGLPFTYPCPKTHQELLEISNQSSMYSLPTVIQRIRALFHPKLDECNKAKLARFSAVLVEHLSFLANQEEHPPFVVLETLIRHLHSLAKSFPEETARAFRAQLETIQESRPTALNAGDLVVLTAIGIIFPTSDHFHQVVTPAMLTMTRYLGLAPPKSLADFAKGAYLCTLCLQYQSLAERYVPEAINCILNSISILSPVEARQAFGDYPAQVAVDGLRIRKPSFSESALRNIDFWDTQVAWKKDDAETEDIKIVILHTNINLIGALADIWGSKSACIEILQPFKNALTHLTSTCSAVKLPPAITGMISATTDRLSALIEVAQSRRRPLSLHHHRPLPIKTAIPRFEEAFNPEKHYDPDRERSELRKLQQAHRKERKGVLRDFRKDASFMAREQLREKKERDAQYEKKFRRLVAEIQGEEGREANAYEREKRLRKGKR